MTRGRVFGSILVPVALVLFLSVDALAQSTAPVDSTKVVIDAGHGGNDHGGLGFAREADVTLAIALHARRVLSEHGVDVILTRDDSEGLTPSQRRAFVGSDTDAFISIHASAATDRSAHGIHTWIVPQTSANEATQWLSLQLAVALQTELVQSTNASDRGIHVQDWYLLQDLPVVAALVEVGFLTHPDEGARLATAAYQELLGQAIADAILRFLHSHRVDDAVASCSAYAFAPAAIRHVWPAELARSRTRRRPPARWRRQAIPTRGPAE